VMTTSLGATDGGTQVTVLCGKAFRASIRPEDNEEGSRQALARSGAPARRLMRTFSRAEKCRICGRISSVRWSRWAARNARLSGAAHWITIAGTTLSMDEQRLAFGPFVVISRPAGFLLQDGRPASTWRTGRSTFSSCFSCAPGEVVTKGETHGCSVGRIRTFEEANLRVHIGGAPQGTGVITKSARDSSRMSPDEDTVLSPR